jgi:uncharacterized protein YfiM (DUF2279 family)
MFLPLLIVGLFLLCQPVFAETDTFGKDKIEHASVSAAIGLATGTLIENKYEAFGVAMIPGILKEIHDSQQKNNFFSKGDLIADAVGAAIGVWVGNTYIRPMRNGLMISGKF